MNIKTDGLLHPIHNSSEFLIKTPLIRELNEVLDNWLFTGVTGGIILGDYRIGKTCAIRYLSKQLKNRLGEKLPVHRMTIAKRDVNTVASIFKNLCFSLNMKPKSRATSDDMAHDIINYFGEIAQGNSTKQVVLIVDEMQRLQMNQFEAFAELYDNLSELKINLSVIFVGNLSDAHFLLKKIEKQEFGLIRGRFFTRSHLVSGLKNVSEVTECLKEFDVTRYPNKTGPTYTEFLLNKHYKQGWRIESLAPLIWEVYYENYKSKYKIKSWGMQYFISMIKILIIDYIPIYGLADEESIKKMIDNSIQASGLIPELVSVT